MGRLVRCLSIGGVLALAAACVTPEPEMPRAPGVTAPAIVRVGTARGIESVPFEDYVLGSVLAEVAPVGETPDTVARILDVQAILARTYVLAHLGRHRAGGFDVCDQTHCQLYDPARIRTSRFSDAARQAVDRTRGFVLTYSGRPIDALYHSDCGGHTSSAEDVWGGAPVAYLVGTADDIPSLTHHSWHFDVPAAQLRTALAADRRSDVGRRLTALSIVDRDAGGRAEHIEVRGDHTVALRGEDIRAILNRTFGDRAIQSTRFSVRPTGTSYRFEGTGFGHGVGLCQVGAAARARQGEPASAILTRYFPGAAIAEIRPPRGPLDPLEGFPTR